MRGGLALASGAVISLLVCHSTFPKILFASTRSEANVNADVNGDVAWTSAILQGIRDAKLGAPMVARSLAIVHTCMYDAWAAYDDRAVGTQLGGALRRPASERTLANKERAVSYAAYRALVDVLPVDTNSVYIPLMKQLGYDPNDNSTDIERPPASAMSPGLLYSNFDITTNQISSAISPKALILTGPAITP